MFGKHKLMKHGEQAQALVLDKRIYAQTVQSNTVTACKYDLRVRFEDGQTTETSVRVHGADVCWPAVGAIVPVRYDAADRSSVVLDEPGLKAELEARAQASRQAALEAGERKLAGRPDESAERLEALRRQTAELRARTAATVASAGLAPKIISFGALVRRHDVHLGQLPDAKRGIIFADLAAAGVPVEADKGGVRFTESQQVDAALEVLKRHGVLPPDAAL